MGSRKNVNRQLLHRDKALVEVIVRKRAMIRKKGE
jgi:hypothetical protein